MATNSDPYLKNRLLIFNSYIYVSYLMRYSSTETLVSLDLT